MYYYYSLIRSTYGHKLGLFRFTGSTSIEFSMVDHLAFLKLVNSKL